ncbi:ABC transporter permease [Halorussus salinisoli]|uniref:ABC transporter permease n=1 Tax=Halorussus salinisoli TaxID=2558242 RepID=UPI0010C20472|nr:ABC transporter permease [Halorussus salinisoli]
MSQQVVRDSRWERGLEQIQEAIRAMWSNPKFLVGTFGLLTFVIVATFAPYITPYDPFKLDVMNRAAPPSFVHPMGTDNFGRDILSRIIMGTRTSVYVGAVSVTIAAGIGVPLGIISGFYGRMLDESIMRLMDALMSFPPVLLALVIMASLGPELTNVLIALGLVYTPFFARVTRSAVLETITEDFVDAARARGESDKYLMVYEIFPNTLPPLIVQATITFAFAILSEAALSFLGMGTQPPTPSWGLMIAEGRDYLARSPWMVLAPGMAIGTVVLSLNLFGDALRDYMDPKVDASGGV